VPERLAPEIAAGVRRAAVRVLRQNKTFTAMQVAKAIGLGGEHVALVGQARMSWSGSASCRGRKDDRGKR
jgi:hypothetical protein